MYAIIRTGGKQYRVKVGDVIRVEKFDGDLGSEMDLTDVVFVGGEKNFIGTPVVANAKVTVVVTNQARGPKVVVFKKKRRQGYRRTNGHRQPFTEIFVKAISNPDGQTSLAYSEPNFFIA
jgi:large subunit ribosomal protein L21